VGPTSPPVISASSHGIRAASAADISHLASTPPDPRVRLRLPATTPTTCSALVVSHHLDGLLRERAVSLLRLTAGQRFTAFPARSSSATPPKRSQWSGSELFPQRVFTPLEGFPSSAAVPCHHGRCLLDVPLTPALPSPPPKSRTLQPATVPSVSKETLVSALVTTEAAVALTKPFRARISAEADTRVSSLPSPRR
jgi:hypothetical protein